MPQNDCPGARDATLFAVGRHRAAGLANPLPCPLLCEVEHIPALLTLEAGIRVPLDVRLCLLICELLTFVAGAARVQNFAVVAVTLPSESGPVETESTRTVFAAFVRVFCPSDRVVLRQLDDA